MATSISKLSGALSQKADGLRLDAALAQMEPHLSRERIKALIAEKRVMIDGQLPRKASDTVIAGQNYAIEIPQAAAATARPQDIRLDVVFEDEHLIVIDKPAGLVVHPAAGNADGTLVNALLYHCAGQLSGIGGIARPGIVHRIDKDTSGLMIAAKSDRAHVGLAEQFADHSIIRRYAAIVQGHPVPPQGTVTGNIGRSPQNRKKMAVVGDGKGKHAVTHYKVQQRLSHSALIECQLETGRTHQVRVHMTHIGHALLGDPLYGRPGKGVRETLKTLNFCRQALHAARLGFIHPVTKEKCDYLSPIPSDMKELLTHLGV